MGSPLAPALACLYMEFWESELLNTIPGPKPIFWVRYIDDILLQWPHSYEDFNIFLRNLNLLEDLINVQAEWELIDPSRPNSATMPFLDLLIHRSPDGFKFNIYRKPTSTDLYTHYYSAHSLPTKRGVLISLFLRALRLCDESFLSSEIEHISSAFRKLKYPPWIIDKALSIATARFHNPTTRRPRRQTTHHLALPDHPSLQSLRPALSNIGIGTSFSTRNTLKKQLSRTGPKAPVDVPGVYSVQCKVADCPKGTYFGETGRNLSKRIREHGLDIRAANTSNALFKHMLDNSGHQFNLRGAKIIYKSTSKPKRQLVEASLIASRPNCNLKPGDFPVDRLSAPAIVKSLNLETIATAPPKTVTPSTVGTSATSTHMPPAPHTSISSSTSSNAPVPQNLPTTLPTPTQSAIHQPPVNTSQPISHTPIALKTRSRTSQIPPSQATTTLATHLKSTKSIPHRPPSKSPSTSHRHTSQPTSPKSPIILQSQARSLPWPTASTLATNHDYFPSPTPVALKTRLRTSQLPSDATPPRRLALTPPMLSPYTPPTAISGAVPRRSKQQRFTPYKVITRSQPDSQPSQSTSAPKPLTTAVGFKPLARKRKTSFTPYPLSRQRPHS